MCEINFVYGLKEKKLNKSDISELLSMCKASGIRNTDGFGAFNDQNQILKAPYQYCNKFGEQVTEKFNGSKFIVAHCRYATTGANMYKNTHPFRVNSFVFCHNGVLSNHDEIRKKYKIDTNIETDSIIIGHVLDYHYHKTKNMAEAIKRMAKEIDGNYSVFLYEKSTKQLYYFRHGASFTFALIRKGDNHYIIGATDEKNLDNKFQTRIFGFPISNATELSRFDPDTDTIYEITDAGIIKLSTFNVPEETYDTDWSKKVNSYYTKSERPTTTIILPDYEEAEATVKRFYEDMKVKHDGDNLICSGSKQFIVDFKGYGKMIKGTTIRIKKKTLPKIANKLNYQIEAMAE